MQPVTSCNTRDHYVAAAFAVIAENGIGREGGDGSAQRGRSVIYDCLVYLLAHCQPSLKISCKSVRKFLRKVANRQADRQTNNDENISSLAEVMNECIYAKLYTVE